ncbi:MAG: crotonobetainyl-CoA:carnitine CoA-transferase CaiB-like acyl-CoA transferase [Myxococcota bacterium]|jgi:crotonobetainyl-CoA:carnitine CoA-transferase CaiB-like acyl-CoA transferase
MSAPLSGIRVVELASFVAAPSCGALLTDLGADVIKVEVPWGELYRHNTPRMAGYDNDFPASAPYQMDNHGKRSLALDLALPQAKDALKKVVDSADVLLTNMLPARLAKYGLDPETLLAERPEFIVARISGFGPNGPEANTPAFDYSAFWSRSGLMSALHDGDAPPAFQRPGIGDHSAGLALTVGILAALRTRDNEGKGQVIDVALQDIGFYIAGNDTSTALVTDESPLQHNRSEPRNPLWNHYECGDGRWIFLVMIESDRYWPLLVEALARPELGQDERFAGGVARFKNSKDLTRILCETFATKPLEHWRQLFDDKGLIWAPVLTVAEAIQEPHAIARGSFPTVEHPEYGAFRTVAPPLRMSKHAMPGNAPAPMLGADTATVCQEAGIDDETTALLLAASD